MLTTTQHSRDSAGLTYVYPVLSRRSGGLSVGINLNPNNACNWRCLYCQVPHLKRGAAPAVDLSLLESELTGFLEEVLHGTFFEKHQIEPGQRRIQDIALSGNGEPTSCPQFAEVVELLGRIISKFGLQPQPLNLQGNQLKLVLITNGSFSRKQNVQLGLSRLGQLGGEAWFKLDSATGEGILTINGVHLSPDAHLLNLQAASQSCPVWLQTCLFALDGEPPTDREFEAYLNFLKIIKARQISILGVLLYGLARPSMQPEAARLSPLQAATLEHFADAIRELGWTVKVSV